MALIKNTLLHVTVTKQGTLPSSKPSGARREGKKGHVKRTLLPAGSGREYRVEEREKEPEVSSTCVGNTCMLPSLCLVYHGQSICIHSIHCLTRGLMQSLAIRLPLNPDPPLTARQSFLSSLLPQIQMNTISLGKAGGNTRSATISTWQHLV